MQILNAVGFGLVVWVISVIFFVGEAKKENETIQALLLSSLAALGAFLIAL